MIHCKFLISLKSFNVFEWLCCNCCCGAHMLLYGDLFRCSCTCCKWDVDVFVEFDEEEFDLAIRLDWPVEWWKWPFLLTCGFCWIITYSFSFCNFIFRLNIQKNYYFWQKKRRVIKLKATFIFCWCCSVAAFSLFICLALDLIFLWR